MRFELSPDEQAVVQAVTAFAVGQLRVGAGKADAAGQLPPVLWSKLRDLGVFGLCAAEDDGGLAVSAATWVACLQALAEADAGVATAVAEHGVAVQLVSATQPADVRAAMADGKQRAAVARWSHAGHLDSAISGLSASPADGRWQLSGTKAWVPCAAAAHWIAALADTATGPQWFAVQSGQSGVQCAAVGEQIGLRSVPAGALVFVAAAGTPCGDGSGAVVDAWQMLSVAAVAAGVARAALRHAGRYALDRVQFGAPIATLQPIQWQIADSAVACDVAELLIAKAAWQLQRDRDGGKPAGPATLLAIRQAKVAAVQAAVAVADRAVQIHGGYGYTREFPVERAMRDAAVLQVLHGTPARCKVQAAQQLAG